MARLGQNAVMTFEPDIAAQPIKPREMIRDALQRPLHDLRISLLDQCNFRCPYCMPEDTFHADYEFLRKSQRLTYEEILRVARVAAGLGVSKIRLTGGEPLMRSDLPSIIEAVDKDRSTTLLGLKARDC